MINESLNDLLGTSKSIGALAASLENADSLSGLQAAVQHILQTVLTGTANVPMVSGVVSTSPQGQAVPSQTATFILAVGSASPVQITVNINPSDDSEYSLNNLVDDINAGLTNAGLAGTVIAGLSGNQITLTDGFGDPIQVSDPNGVASLLLSLPTQAGSSLRAAIEGLPANVPNTQFINLAGDLANAVANSTSAAQLASAIVATAGSLNDEIQALAQPYGFVATTLMGTAAAPSTLMPMCISNLPLVMQARLT